MDVLTFKLIGADGDLVFEREISSTHDLLFQLGYDHTQTYTTSEAAVAVHVPEDSGPDDQEIEDEAIEADIERQEDEAIERQRDGFDLMPNNDPGDEAEGD